MTFPLVLIRVPAEQGLKRVTVTLALVVGS